MTNRDPQVSPGPSDVEEPILLPREAAKQIEEAMEETARARFVACAHDHGAGCDCGGDKVRAALALLREAMGEGKEGR